MSKKPHLSIGQLRALAAASVQAAKVSTTKPITMMPLLCPHCNCSVESARQCVRGSHCPVIRNPVQGTKRNNKRFAVHAGSVGGVGNTNTAAKLMRLSGIVEHNINQ